MQLVLPRSLLLLLTLIPLACGEDSERLAMDTAAIAFVPSSAPAAPAMADFSGKDLALSRRPRGVAGGTAAERFGGTGSQQTASNITRAQTAPNMIIRNGEVSVQVDSVEVAMDAVRRLATSLGGSIGNVAVQTGEHQVRSATLEMKVPVARFEDAMGGMAPLGKVERSVETAADVGEEFVDVTARVANAKRLESRLVALLTTRTGKLEDVLAVERELARVREEIERYEGRIRYLSTRVAMSTIVATVHEKAPIIAARPGTNVIGQAFINMWRNFVRFVATGIEALGVVVPMLILAFLLATGWRRWRRSRIPAPI